MEAENAMTTARKHKSFLRDRRGVAAVEFGLIAPVLLVMLIGVVEVTRAVSIDRRFGQVTAMVADLLAREERVDAATVEGIYGIVEHVMGVWGTDTLKLHIYPVRASTNDANDVYVYAAKQNRPSYGPDATSPKDVCQRYTGLTTNLLAQQGMAIIVEGEYGYSPLLANGILGSSTWRDKAVLSPRTGCVSFEPENTAPQPDCIPSPGCE
jgi:Flp pilus assembly protein TadG